MRNILYSMLLCCFTIHASAQCTPLIHTNTGNNFICDGGTTYIFASLADTYQWYLDGVAISGAINNNYGATTPGSYTVEVDSVGCVATSAPLLLTVNSSPDIPGSITSADTLCEGSLYTFSVDPVPGADRYEWATNHSYTHTFWPGLDDDTTNIATTFAGPSASSSSGQTMIKVFAINACGMTVSNKSVGVYTPIREYGYGINPDGLGWGMFPFCPSATGNQQIRIEVSRAEYSQGYVPPVTYQWYLDNVSLLGETDKYLTIHRGGDYVVKAATGYCNTLTVAKHVKQNVPGSATITPQGPLNFCANNAQPLHVVFDMTGVDGDFSWAWMLPPSIPYAGSVYSILPDTTGYYAVWAYDPVNFGNCEMMYPIAVNVTIPQPLEVTQTDDTLFATPGYDSYQWFDSGVVLPGETQQKLILTVDGFYTVEGVFMNGCVESSFSFNPVFSPPPPPPPPPGTNSQQPNEEMSVSPNPAGSSFVLNAKIAPKDNKATVVITDATGRIMLEKEIDVVDGIVEEKIDLGDASASMGIIKLRSAHTLSTTKFFKK